MSADKIEFVNALRNTRINPEIPAMGYTNARANYLNQRAQAQNAPSELASDFDYMLSQLMAQSAMASMDYTRKLRHGTPQDALPETPLTKVEDIWSEIFPGRELAWKDWSPMVKSTVGDTPMEYSANTMSDGEKAALYLASKIFSAEPGVIVVDEPETHFHSLLAVRFWNSLEAARDDLRFVYITHDMTFALSRRDAAFIMADPVEGLRLLPTAQTVPKDMADILLGTASFSFYAKRAVFCEGNNTSLDKMLYEAWFDATTTAVRAVGSCDRVLRSVETLKSADIIAGLQPLGIIDRDFHPDAFFDAQPAEIHVLPVHEVESLFAIPSVVAAVCAHLGLPLDEAVYGNDLRVATGDTERHKIIMDRWKARLRPQLETLLSSTSSRTDSLADIVKSLPEIFNHTKWAFDPEAALEEEKLRVETALSAGELDEILRLTPGKKFRAIVADAVGMQFEAYAGLVTAALSGKKPELSDLESKLALALNQYLPPRVM